MKFLMLASALFVVPIQGSNAALAGTWTAQLGSRIYVRLELTSTNGKLGGKIATSDIRVNDQGEVIEAGEIPSKLTPLSDVVLRGETITFTRLQGSDLEHFEIRFLADGAAEIAFMPSDELLRELKEEGAHCPFVFTAESPRAGET